MTMSMLVLSLLLLAMLAACLRLLLGWRRAPGGVPPWRRIALLLAQPLFAMLLYFTLFPPQRPASPVSTLTVLTESATVADVEAARDIGMVLALPEAPREFDVERIPDLGTALRRHPDVQRVRIVGAGLAPRDRDAAQAVAIEPVLAPLPRGLRRLHVSAATVAGATLTVSGEVGAVPEGRVELLDPAGRRVDAVPLADDGSFRLNALAFAPGAAELTLRVLDAGGAIVESAAVPVWIGDAVVARVLLLAGAPNPETRALQRWMQDAGFASQSRIALGGGIHVGDAPVPTMDALSRFDLLLVDARSWNDLGDAARVGVLQAVEGGLGLLLRADAALTPSALRVLRADGFDISAGAAPAMFQPESTRLADATAVQAWAGMGTENAPAEVEAGSTVPELGRRAWRVSGTQAVPLARDAKGEPVGWWRQHGQGRVGLWSPVDTWQLSLIGRRDLYASLWNGAFSTLVRARPQAALRVEGEARVDGRVALCGLSAEAVVDAPGRTGIGLLPDAAANDCAAFWPGTPGWHRLRDGEAVLPFHVLPPDALPGVRLASMRDATLALATRPIATQALGKEARLLPARRSSSWPWFAAWLLLAAALWWFERSRPGQAKAANETP